MAHFAQLDENNKVINVIVVHNNEIDNASGLSGEAKGIQFCKDHFGQDTIWKQTSYSGSFRKMFAGFGFTYDASRDAFISPPTFPSWVLNETTWRWESPVPMPSDIGTGTPPKLYLWDEATTSWVLDMK